MISHCSFITRVLHINTGSGVKIVELQTGCGADARCKIYSEPGAGSGPADCPNGETVFS